MADVVSMGLHRPSALSYLIAESILPNDPPESAYTWTTHQGHGDVSEEELLSTANCVVWSQDGHIRKVFKFDGEEQKITQAVLTRFRFETPHEPDLLKRHPFPVDNDADHSGMRDESLRAARWGTRAQHESRYIMSVSAESNASPTSNRPELEGYARALIILLKSEIHVHYLSGPSHVVSLPFEIERAFPAVEGLVVQRKRIPLYHDPLHPAIPRAPPNSFYTSQGQLFSPQKLPGIATDAWLGATASPAGHIPQLDNLMRGLRSGQDSQANDDMPHLYSFSNPLSDFAAISHAAYCRQARFSRSEGENDTIVEYDMLDQDESLVYISSHDELSISTRIGDAPLILVVTINEATRQISLWQAWYLKPQSLTSLLSRRAANKAARARRRSSFMTTGATTPAVRHQDRSRESFAAAARLPVDVATHHIPGGLRSLQDAEEVMASQMDPDYLPTKQPTQIKGRISSVLSRGEATINDPSIKQTALGASFGAGGRRGPSIGSFNDRRSMGSYAHRKSRGSTPGSVFSRSVGPDDDNLQVSRDNEDMDDEYEVVERLIEASHNSAGAESVFGGATDGLRKDMVLRKLETYSCARSAQHTSSGESTSHSNIRVTTLARTSRTNNDDRFLDLHILDKDSESLSAISLYVQRRAAINPAKVGGKAVGYMPIPFVESHIKTEGIHDLVGMHDGESTATVLSTTTQGLIVVPSGGIPWTVHLPSRAHLNDPSSVWHSLNTLERDIGRARTVQLPAGLLNIKRPGTSGQIAVQTVDGYSHRVQIKLAPKNDAVRHVLRICEFVLSEKGKKAISTLWCNAYHRFKLGNLQMTDGMDLEWEALIVTLFAFAVGSVGRQLRVTNKSPNKQHSRNSSPNASATAFSSQGHHRVLKSEFERARPSAWGWLGSSSFRSRRDPPLQKPRQKSSRKPGKAKDVPFSMTEYEAMARHILHDIAVDELDWLISPKTAELRILSSLQIMLTLHLYREEQKLDVVSDTAKGLVSNCLSAMIAQFGQWLSLKAWTNMPNTYHELDGTPEAWDISACKPLPSCKVLKLTPFSLHEWCWHHATSSIQRPSFCVSMGRTKLCTWSGRYFPFPRTDCQYGHHSSGKYGTF